METFKLNYWYKRKIKKPKKTQKNQEKKVGLATLGSAKLSSSEIIIKKKNS